MTVDQSFSIVLPLRKKVRLDPGDLIREVRLLVEATGATVRIDPRMIHQAPSGRGGLLGTLRSGAAPEVVAFELDGVRLRITQHAEPFADRSGIGRYVNPVMWDTGLGEFTDHRAYLRVHEAGIEGEEGPDAVFDRAASVTATASVVARLAEPVGAIWVSARNSVPMRSFVAAMERLKEGHAPLEFWLRWHVIPPGEMDDLHSGIVTGGLGAFIGREILAKPSRAETREMIDHAFELARRMIDEKIAVSDGQVVEGAGGTRLRIKLGGRFRKGEVPVCEIELVDPPAARARPSQPETRALPSLDEVEAALRLALEARPNAAPGGEAPAGPAAQPAGEGAPPRAEGGPDAGRPAGPAKRVIRLVPGGRGGS
jgi:hypothetical protein